jgi:hypothetical protein
MPSYNIVISRYNENLDWVNKLNKEYVYIYNKGNTVVENSTKRENIGREIETFLYHIIVNYDNLPDYLILLQGNPFDHMNNIDPDNLQINIDLLINSNIENIQPLFCNTHYENHGVYPSIKSSQYYSLFFDGIVPSQSIFSPGCQYIIPKKNILNRSIHFYTLLHYMSSNSKIVDVNESCYGNHLFDQTAIDPWCLERLLMFVFCEHIRSTQLFI